MKKLKNFGLILFCVLFCIVLFRCGEELTKNKDNIDNTDKIRIGTLENFGLNEKELETVVKRTGINGAFPSQKYPAIIYYNDLKTMQRDLESGKIDVISSHFRVAKYLVNENPNYELTDFDDAHLTDYFCSAVRKEDKELLVAMNEAISSMQTDGTLNWLVNDYIYDVLNGEKTVAVPMVNVKDRPTIKVGITGNLPPIDSVKSDDSPIGFNTAVLAEIGRRIGRNIETVKIDSGSRIIALKEKRIDVIFVVLVPAENFTVRPSIEDKDLGISLTIPYYQDDIVHIKLESD